MILFIKEIHILKNLTDNMTLFKHIITESPIGEITIIWKDEPKFIIEEIFISTPSEKSSAKSFEKYEQNEILKEKKCRELDDFLVELDNYFNERDYKFSLKYLNLDKLTPFQRKVLIEEFNTEKGTVNSYKHLAKKIDSPKSYRAVGNALSKNPYPIVIPCHRTVKSDRTLGGYAGMKEGIETKKTLLEIEGLIIQGKKVISDSTIVALNKKEQQRLI